MSHCTVLEISFQDKRMLYRALRNEGLNPENRIWQSFDSELRKKWGLGGTDIGKLLTGTDGDVHIGFIETEDGLQPFVESPTLTGPRLEARAQQLVFRVQSAYLRCAVEEAVRTYREAGIAADVSEHVSSDGVSFTIQLGHGNKSITVTRRADGVVEERVQGVEGRSCTDATAVLERLLARPNQLERTWLPEYDAVVEDRMIQVLRLTRS